MMEKASVGIEVFSLNEQTGVKPAVDAVMNGKIVVLKVGPVFSLVFNPNITGLSEKLNILKDRHNNQILSAICTYEQAKKIVDVNRVNQDFFRLSGYFCGKALIRIPVNTTIPNPVPFNSEDDTLQFLDFEEAHPIRSAFMEELALRGCKFLSITSANIHSAPTIEDLESAKMLAALFNIKTSFLGMHDVQTVVADIPADTGTHKGSYIILSFCNPQKIEVKRLANKTDREMTERYLKELFTKVHTQTPLEYAL